MTDHRSRESFRERSLLAVLAACCGGGCDGDPARSAQYAHADADGGPPVGDGISFASEVQPILVEWCRFCHGKETREPVLHLHADVAWTELMEGRTELPCWDGA